MMGKLAEVLKFPRQMLTHPGMLTIDNDYEMRIKLWHNLTILPYKRQISDKNVKLGYGFRRMVKYMDIGHEGLKNLKLLKVVILSSSSTVYNLFLFPQCSDKLLGDLHGTLIKKKKKIFLIYKAIQTGAVASKGLPYMINGLLKCD